MTARGGTRDPEQRLDRMRRTNAVLAQVSREIGPALDLKVVLDTVLSAMRGLMEFRGASIQLVEGDELHIAASDPPVSEDVRVSRVPVGGGLSGQAVATGQSLYSPDVDLDPRVDGDQRRRGTNAGMRSYLVVPLVCLGEVIGLLQVDSLEADAFDEDDRAMLEGLATQVAGAIESARRFEQVMELERLKSDFIGRISHELRTPITIVGGFVATLLDHGERIDDTQRRYMLSRIDNAIKRLGALIEDLITLARLETGVVIAHPDQTVVPEVLDEVRRSAADPELVEVECPDGLVVTTDPELLRRGLGLLVDNALKYGGEARVVATEDEIRVVDHGPGIPADVRPTVFELFTRGSATTTVPGLGLGLPMARTLFGVLGAEISLESPPSGGTVVCIHLPR